MDKNDDVLDPDQILKEIEEAKADLIVKGSEESVNTSRNDILVEARGFVNKLLARSRSIDEISKQVGVSATSIRDIAVGKDSIEFQDIEILLLRNFANKELIKSLFRQSAFLSSQKIAEKLMLDKVYVEELYDALIGTGELTYALESPDWYGKPDKKLRKHSVK